MAVTVTVSAIAVVISMLVAAVIVGAASYGVLTLTDRVRRRRLLSPLEQVEADYQAARRAMNDAAGQSWRNLID